MTYGEIVIKSGEKIRVEESYKYSPQQSSLLWERAGLVEYGKWGTRAVDNPYCKLPLLWDLLHLDSFGDDNMVLFIGADSFIHSAR